MKFTMYLVNEDQKGVKRITEEQTKGLISKLGWGKDKDKLDFFQNTKAKLDMGCSIHNERNDKLKKLDKDVFNSYLNACSKQVNSSRDLLKLPKGTNIIVEKVGFNTIKKDSSNEVKIFIGGYDLNEDMINNALQEIYKNENTYVWALVTYITYKEPVFHEIYPYINKDEKSQEQKHNDILIQNLVLKMQTDKTISCVYLLRKKDDKSPEWQQLMKERSNINETQLKAYNKKIDDFWHIKNDISSSSYNANYNTFKSRFFNDKKTYCAYCDGCENDMREKLGMRAINFEKLRGNGFTPLENDDDIYFKD